MFSVRSVVIAVTATCGLFLAPAPSATAADAKATGTITLNGKPLAAGKVTFHLANGQFVGAKIKDGKYTVDRVPVGTLHVTIDGKGVPLKYSADETSGLVVEVAEGNLPFDFDLK